MIKFETEFSIELGETMHYAVTQLVKHRGRMRDELLWAGIIPSGKVFVVKWEDEWMKTEHKQFLNLEDAKKYVTDNYKEHEPVETGPNWEDE